MGNPTIMCQINDGKPVELIEFTDGKFSSVNLLTINDFPSEGDLNKLKESGGSHNFLVIKDSKGNTFKVYPEYKNR